MRRVPTTNATPDAGTHSSSCCGWSHRRANQRSKHEPKREAYHKAKCEPKREPFRRYESAYWRPHRESIVEPECESE